MLRTSRHALAAAGTALVLGAAGLVAPSPAVAADAAVSLHANQRDARGSELVLLRGRAVVDGRAAGGRRVELLARAPGGRLRTVEVTRTGPRGRYTVQDRRRGAREYRVRLERRGGALLARSRIVHVGGRGAARTLEERHAAWRKPLGAARSGVRTTGRVRYREFARGIVAQRGRNASIVQGAVLRAYRDNGGVGGRLGAPLADQHCQLLGSGCLQRFQRGAIYIDPRGQRTVNVVRGRPAVAAHIAVGRSQVGYVEPSRNASKFNDWMGNDNPWCGFFQAWVSRASGNGDLFPKAVNFRRQVAKVEARGTRIARPRVGSVVFFDYRGWNRPSHVGFVTAVHTNGTITTLDGNTGPRDARGVKESVRSTRQVHSYWLLGKP